MTSPALLVLILAHVCSIIGTALERAADDEHKPNMVPNHATHNIHNKWTNIHYNLDESNSEYINQKYDDIFKENAEGTGISVDGKMNLKMYNAEKSKVVGKRRGKREDSYRCDDFFIEKGNVITIPRHSFNNTYYSSISCGKFIKAPNENSVIKLTFIDEFGIEYHPQCAFDYLEIRDGQRGYAKLLDRVCGSEFPGQITTTGPYAWLKFHSDDTIEDKGFKILVEYHPPTTTQSVTDHCNIDLSGTSGEINLATIEEKCGKSNANLDILWTITTDENKKIYLNITDFKLEKSNECDKNVVEVFGQLTETDDRLEQYCGTIANAVSTKGENDNDKSSDVGNIMHVRVFVIKELKEKTRFKATFTAYRTLNPNTDEACYDDEYDCYDNTCIDKVLVCNNEANCRLKRDEEDCVKVAETMFSQQHILIILIIFCLILATMCFIFLFKCIRKLYQDQKIIKEHIREACADRLDMMGSRLTLDPKRLHRDSEPRASLERENQVNEMCKRKRDSFSKRKSTSLCLDDIQEIHVDIDKDPWRRQTDNIPTETDEVRAERHGNRHRREKKKQDERGERASEKQIESISNMSKQEESKRSKRETERREKEEIRDVSEDAPDTNESECQTRESLLQVDAPSSSHGSGTNSRGLSTFGYSGATVSRPSPPATNTSEITIELLMEMPRQDSVKPQKKIPDRRPMSAETTRSAPDVIIVAKPIR